MNSSGDARNPVERLAEDFIDRKRRGERPTLQEYVDRHPANPGNHTMPVHFSCDFFLGSWLPHS
jgi:hypothetical protein